FDRYDREFDTFTATATRLGFIVDQRESLDRPIFRQTYGPDFRDLSQSTGALSLAYQHPRDRQVTGSVDFQQKHDFAGFSLRGKLTVLAGVRGERAEDDTTGNVTNAGVVRQTIREGDYTKFFPSVHGRYAITPGLHARLSYSTTMNRPAIADLIPTTTVTSTG